MELMKDKQMDYLMVHQRAHYLALLLALHWVVHSVESSENLLESLREDTSDLQSADLTAKMTGYHLVDQWEHLMVLL